MSKFSKENTSLNINCLYNYLATSLSPSYTEPV